MQHREVTRDETDAAIEPVKCPKCGVSSELNYSAIARYRRVELWQSIRGIFSGAAVSDRSEADPDGQPELEPAGFVCQVCRHHWQPPEAEPDVMSPYQVTVALTDTRLVQQLTEAGYVLTEVAVESLRVGDFITGINVRPARVVATPNTAFDIYYVVTTTGTGGQDTRQFKPGSLVQTWRGPTGDLVPSVVREYIQSSPGGRPSPLICDGLTLNLCRVFTASSVSVFVKAWQTTNQAQWEVLVPLAPGVVQAVPGSTTSNQNS